MPEAVLCPLPAALTTIPAETCRDIFAKAAKFIFQRAATANYFNGTLSPPTIIEDADSWSGLPDAAGATKVVVTPILENVVFGEQEDFTNGENLDGAPIQVASGVTPVTAQIRNPTPAEMSALRDLRIEENIWVIALDAEGNFLARLQAATIHSGFSISKGTYKVKGPSREGTASDNFMATIMFCLKYDWYDNADMVAPEAGFDPLTAIVPA